MSSFTFGLQLSGSSTDWPGCLLLGVCLHNRFSSLRAPCMRDKLVTKWKQSIVAYVLIDRERNAVSWLCRLFYRKELNLTSSFVWIIFLNHSNLPALNQCCWSSDHCSTLLDPHSPTLVNVGAEKPTALGAPHQLHSVSVAFTSLWGHTLRS